MGFRGVHTADQVKHAIFMTLAANGMRDDVHIRLTLSRGDKTTSSMNPKFNVFGCTLIVLAEFKPVVSVATYDNQKGVALITAAGRRNPPMCVDSKIHHNNLINNIIPKMQANLAGTNYCCYFHHFLLLARFVKRVSFEWSTGVSRQQSPTCFCCGWLVIFLCGCVHRRGGRHHAGH